MKLGAHLFLAEADLGSSIVTKSKPGQDGGARAESGEWISHGIILTLLEAELHGCRNWAGSEMSPERFYLLLGSEE